MELVRVLPSAEDEVNVACFHPSVGGGLVYGTKVNRILYLHFCFLDITSLDFFFRVYNLFINFAVKCRKGSLGSFNTIVLMP